METVQHAGMGGETRGRGSPPHTDPSPFATRDIVARQRSPWQRQHITAAGLNVTRKYKRDGNI